MVKLEMLLTCLSKSSDQLSPYHLPASRKTAVLWMCGSKTRDSCVTSCHSAEAAVLAVSTRGQLLPWLLSRGGYATWQIRCSLKPFLPLWLLLVRSCVGRERRDMGFVQ